MGSNCIDISGPEQLIYIPCNFCNIILAVSVPRTSLFDIVTVCCGHCSNLWSVNMAAAFRSALPGPDLRHQYHQVPNYLNGRDDCYQKDQCLGGSSAKMAKKTNNMQDASKKPSVERLANRLPEKKQRVPSAYNQFIKEEIQRIKANYPDISHREAFSTAAKNWAHFPHIHFGLMLENNINQTRFDQNKAGKRLMCKGAEVMKM